MTDKQVPICPFCTARSNAHFLTCVSLDMPEDWSFEMERQ